MNLEQKIEKLAEYINKSQNIVFFGGAGVSTESGIPDFRSTSGIYTSGEYDAPPEVMISRTYFFEHTDKFYDFYKTKLLYRDAEPNDAHKVLARLEDAGKLKAVITQNVDNLHRMAGSKNVIELHGNASRNICLKCKKVFDVDYILKSEKTPLCDECGGVIKPDVVLYEESLNDQAVMSAVEHISSADMLIVGGTSLAVYPAAHYIVCFNRESSPSKKSAIINMSMTSYDDMFDISICEDGIGSVLSKAYAKL
jgi:NAD-dependent deacetylase